MRDLRKLGIKKIDLNNIRDYLNISDYTQLYNAICSLIDEEVIKPIKKSGTNGMKPALYNKYFIIDEQKDYSMYKDEINFNLNPTINTSYYLKNISKYIEDRENILKLSIFLDKSKHKLENTISKNERSFQIWQKEKFLSDGKGEKLLKNLGFDLSFLNIYETTEPIAYYSVNKNVPQNILIIENKDTFYSIRKYLMETSCNQILGQNISTVIYGSGKKIYKSFSDFKLCGEPYFFDKNNRILYFGDLDYEGIIIYEGIYEMFKDNIEIELFNNAYTYMIDKYISNNIELPDTKEFQNKNIRDIFLNNFNEKYRELILDILTSGRYIPQEIINITDIMEKCNAI